MGIVRSLLSLRTLGVVFWLCIMVYTLDGAAYFGVLQVTTLFLQTIGFSDKWAGLTVALYTGGLTILGAVFGGLTDVWGVRKTLIVSVGVAVAGRALLAAAPRLPMAPGVALTALLLMAFSAGVMTPAVYAGVKQSTSEENSAFAFSLIYAGMNGGSFLESLASSPVRARWGVAAVVFMCAAITAAYFFVLLVVFPRNKGGPVPRVEKKTGSGGPLDARFLYFISILLGVRTLFAHQWLTMPDYVTRAYPAEVGARFEWINGLNPLIILIGTPLVALLTKNIHVLTMMIFGTLVSASATLLLVPGPNLTALLGYVIVFSAGEAIWSSRFYEYVTQMAPADRVGVYMGIAQVPWFLAKSTTGLYSGTMLERFCPAAGPKDTGTMWLVYGAIGMISPLGLLLAQSWLRRGMGTRLTERPT